MTDKNEPVKRFGRSPRRKTVKKTVPEVEAKEKPDTAQPATIEATSPEMPEKKDQPDPAVEVAGPESKAVKTNASRGRRKQKESERPGKTDSPKESVTSPVKEEAKEEDTKPVSRTSRPAKGRRPQRKAPVTAEKPTVKESAAPVRMAARDPKTTK